MGGIGIAYFDLQKSDTAAPAPAYLRPVTDWLDGLVASSKKPTFDEFFHQMLNPRPVQLFFAEFLNQNLTFRAAQYRAEAKAKDDESVFTAQDIVHKMRDMGTYLPRKPNGKVRRAGTCPMTSADFARSARHITDPFVNGVGALLQAGLDEYYDELRAVLIADYGINAEMVPMKRINVGKEFQSFWKELVPQFALAYHRNGESGATPDAGPFAGAYDIARNNDAFRSIQQVEESSWHGTKHKIKKVPRLVECPAQFMIKHLLNTDFIERPDGTLAIARAPRNAALPAFIHRRLHAEAQAAPACPMRALTAG